MRRGYALLVTISFLASLSVCGLSFAEDGISNEQLKRMYDDAVAQLKGAQDRRNDLARENQKLLQRITQLEKEVDAKVEEVHTIADRTFQARAEQEAYAKFLRTNPEIRARWEAYLKNNFVNVPESGDVLDRDWPLPRKR